LSSVQEVTYDSDDPTDDPNTFVVTEVTTLAKIFSLKRNCFSELPVLQGIPRRMSSREDVRRA